MAQPLVSVIIPCFNAGPMLRPALRSVVEQSYPNLEIIFVDNNSTDGSLDRARDVAATGPRPFVIASCREQGGNYARNHGYGLTRGVYVQWLDDDDLLGPDKIARQVAAMEEDRAIDVAYCDWVSRRYLPDGPPQEERRHLGDVPDQLMRILAQDWYPTHTYLLRRAAADRLQQEEAWFPGRGIVDDIEYIAIATLLGLRFRHVPGATVGYNIWSDTAQQSGTVTPYPVRAGALRDVYRRLAILARRPDIAPRITARHRILLQQDWSVWAFPADSVQLTRQGSRLFMLRHQASGRALKLRPREASVAQALLITGGRQVIAHHALRIAVHSPALGEDMPFVVATLDKLLRAGMLTLVAEAVPATAAPPTPVPA